MTLETEPKPIEKDHGPWPIEFADNGKTVLGLPEGRNRNDVIIKLFSDGHYYALNPTKEDLEEQDMWEGNINTADVIDDIIRNSQRLS